MNETTHKFIDVLANNEKGNNRTVLANNDPMPGDDVWNKMKSCKHCNNYVYQFQHR